MNDISGAGWQVMFGSCLDRLPELADNSIDAVVTDPPYELGFMGKLWDSSGIAFNPQVWAECLRVLKPGGHLLAFGGSRTWHRIAVAIEDAGFEVRDSIAWLYGSGFPKSLDVSKAIDKAAGVEREIVTETVVDIFGEQEVAQENVAGKTSIWNSEGSGGNSVVTAPATVEAQKWQGWGTALKPAFEPVVVARKPLVGTVAANVLEWGTGGLNIDGTRIGTDGGTKKIDPEKGSVSQNAYGTGLNGGTVAELNAGRWPANVMLDEYTAALLDEQSGISISKSGGKSGTSFSSGVSGLPRKDERKGHDDSGGASRFFYVAKASKRDRNEGLDGLEAQRHSDREKADGVGGDNPRNRTNQARQNFHPTVKPTDLMRQLVRLVTPPGGVVLDPFTGSGSTGKAAILEGFEFIGCELTEDYLPIIDGRLSHATDTVIERGKADDEKLF